MAAGKPTAVHFSLMFFVMLSIILGVVSYLSVRDLQDAKKAETAAKSEEAKMRKVVNDRDDQVQTLKGLIGHQLADIGQPGSKEPNTVVGVSLSDFQKYSADQAQPDYASAIKSLRQTLDNERQQNTALKADLIDHKQQILALQKQYQDRVDNFQASANSERAEKLKLSASKAEALLAKDQEIETLRKNYSDAKLEISVMQEAHANAIKQRDQEIVGLTQINDQLREKMEDATKLSFEHPDGIVRWVDHTRGLVWINLGQDDKLPKRLTFSVYTKAHHGVGGGKEDIKGSIEITRVISAHLAEARVLDTDIYRPMAPGDPIYTPMWSPGRTESFSFVGLVDVDDDGRSDRKMLHDLIAAAGAHIDNEIDDEGNRTGDGLSVKTKFLVIGTLPDPTQSLPDERAAHEKILKHHTDLRKEARLQGVRVISLNDFLAYIGFKPSRRLWMPGDKVTFKLKNGSHSTGTNETIGGRESSGQTAGIFSRSKRLKQPYSTGQTSKNFKGATGGY